MPNLAPAGLSLIGLSASSASFLNAVGTLLDERLDAAVGTASTNGDNAYFLDPTTAFAGKGVCGNPQLINSFVLWTTTTDKVSLPGPRRLPLCHSAGG